VTLTSERIAAAVINAGFKPLAGEAAEQFSRYSSLLALWNSKLNLTAIRDPEEVLQRHFLECIFCAQHLPDKVATLMDYGSGGGFPGVPIAVCRPEIRVTLAESQGKKASFLREVVRSLNLNAEVFAGRVEAMAPEQLFDAVALRAVDKMQEAVGNAASRVRPEGWLLSLATAGAIELPASFVAERLPIPGSQHGELIIARRS
jgi:16S rRNA (guanine527-N7)-methyltransferase